MKKSILFLTLIAPFALFGLAGGASASQRQVIARLDASMKNYGKVTLYEDGELDVKGVEGQLLASKQLGPSTAATLKGFAQRVANVQVTSTYKEVVCMTFVAVSFAELSVARMDAGTYQFFGAPRLVLSGRGCSFHSETFPVSKNDLHSADVLKQSLELLAIDAIENR